MAWWGVLLVVGFSGVVGYAVGFASAVEQMRRNREARW